MIFLKDLDTDLFGELYLNSVDRDGTGQGYMIEMVQKFKKLNNFPIIIAGGAGNWRHLLSGLKNKDINAVSTANLLNFIGDGFKQARIELTKRFDLQSGEKNKIFDCLTLINIQGIFSTNTEIFILEENLLSRILNFLN